MNAATVIADLVASGVRLRLEGDRLRVQAASPESYTADHRAAVAAHRAGILALLAAPVTPAIACQEAPRPALIVEDPAADLAALGGYAGAAVRFGLLAAFRLWDSARLWERDRDTPRGERWLEQYQAARAAAEGTEQ